MSEFEKKRSGMSRNDENEYDHYRQKHALPFPRKGRGRGKGYH